MRTLRTLVAVSLALCGAPVAQGVVFLDPHGANASYNTGAPGDTRDIAWSLSGLWGNATGTPIAPYFFITAKHWPVTMGTNFTLNGTSYTPVANGTFDDPESDLRIVQVAQAFTNWMPIYTGSSEVGSELFVVGRGRERGLPVTVNSTLKGWQHGNVSQDTHVKRWGENIVEETVFPNGTASPNGTLLYATFDSGSSLSSEAHLSIGDSGGGVFIQDGGTWKLAGVNYAVDGPFRYTANGTDFQATLFDARGLYVGGTLINPGIPSEVPSGFYATRISKRASWIASVIPEPGSAALLLAAAGWLALARRGRRRG